MPQDRIIATLKRRLARWELDHLRSLAGQQADRIERLETELDIAQQNAEFWERHAHDLMRDVSDLGKTVGITPEGDVGVVDRGLLDRGDADPLNAQVGDGSVVDGAVSADEENDVFVVGRFQRLSYTQVDGLQGADFLEPKGHAASVHIFRVSAKSIERLTSDISKFCIVSDRTADTAGGDDVLSVDYGVVKEILNPVDCVLDYMAGKHVLSPVARVVVCEGLQTAYSIAQQLASASLTTREKFESIAP